MKRLTQITITIFITLLAFVAVWSFRPALELFGGSLALSAMLRPLVRLLEQRGIARSWAILIWYVLLLAVFGGLGFVFSLGLSGDIASGIEGFPAWYTSLLSWLGQLGVLGQSLVGVMPAPEVANELLRELLSGTAIELLGGSLEQIVLLLATLSLSFYWLSEVSSFERLWLSLLPVATRVRARDIWRNTETAVGAYILATLSSVVLASLLLLGVYSLAELLPGVAGLPFMAVLALLGGLSHLIPRIGPAVMLLISTALAATVAPLLAGIVLLSGVVVHVAVDQLALRVMGANTGRVNPLLQVLLLLVLGELGGLGALIFAPPLAAFIQVLNDNLRSIRSVQPSEERALAQLEGRLAALEAQSDPDQLEFLSALRRSKDLMLQARKLLD
ncbi:MAG: AI-2E family transporter [Roseiflexaceae bacterium]|nr:AI-2E family transporter [Roseiflexaceae bacterium]